MIPKIAKELIGLSIVSLASDDDDLVYDWPTLHSVKPNKDITVVLSDGRIMRVINFIAVIGQRVKK